MPLRPFASFYPSAQPPMTRPSYRRELVSASTFSVARSLLEGGVIGVLAKYVFDVNNFGFAVVVAAPMLANITSPMWARLSHGRAKVRFISTLMALVLAINIAIASLPVGPIGAALLVALVVIARCLLAGVIIIRSNVWRTNYRRDVRGQITSRFFLVMTLIFGVTPMVGYAIQDLDTVFFRLTYGMSSAIGLIGVIAYAGIRLRKERGQLAFEKRVKSKPTDQDANSTSYKQDQTARQPNGKPHNFLSVLRTDKRFRQYMVWQFIAGASNMMGETAMLRYIVEVFRDYRFEKALAVLLNASLPMTVCLLTLPLWAKFLDRNHIAAYRTRHGICWIVTQSMNFVVASTGALWLVPLPRILQGTMMGGGRIAFNLGHYDFADRRLVSLYMGIHQTLAGIRGCTVPFIGVFLLMGWQRTEFGPIVLPAWSGIGAGVFIVTTVLGLIGYLGFFWLHHQLKRSSGAATVND